MYATVQCRYRYYNQIGVHQKRVSHDPQHVRIRGLIAETLERIGNLQRDGILAIHTTDKEAQA